MKCSFYSLKFGLGLATNQVLGDSKPPFREGIALEKIYTVLLIFFSCIIKTYYYI